VEKQSDSLRGRTYVCLGLLKLNLNGKEVDRMVHGKRVAGQKNRKV